jgi:hypothetical protein
METEPRVYAAELLGTFVLAGRDLAGYLVAQFAPERGR